MKLIKQYVKKPVVVRAVLYDGSTQSIEAIKSMKNNDIYLIDCKLYIHTLEGDMLASKGDYVIQGVNGEIYPCKPDIFMKTYQEVVS
jgi:hypothetical protein